MKLKEVIDLTGISERNIKYWCGIYGLEVTKSGRENIYPYETLQALKIIKLLTDTQFFSQKFIEIYVEFIKTKKISAGDLAAAALTEEKFKEILSACGLSLGLFGFLNKSGTAAKTAQTARLDAARKKEEIEIL